MVDCSNKMPVLWSNVDFFKKLLICLQKKVFSVGEFKDFRLNIASINFDINQLDFKNITMGGIK